MVVQDIFQSFIIISKGFVLNVGEKELILMIYDYLNKHIRPSISIGFGMDRKGKH